MNAIVTLNLSGVLEPQMLHSGSVRFIGTATTLIRFGGFTVLTDPNFLHAGDHAHFGYAMTSPRLTNPAMDIGQLPPLDLCVLSHMHVDHWDDVAREQLPKSLLIVTTPEARDTLREQGFGEAIGLRRWEALDVRRGSQRLKVTAMPGRSHDNRRA